MQAMRTRQRHYHARMACAGILRSCDPNRVVLKKIVLSGYPVRVHKTKGVVRWMFHSAEDVRWFRPLGLWTKRGRHGHIKVLVAFQASLMCVPSQHYLNTTPMLCCTQHFSGRWS